jgi:hypothetical protein
MLVALSDCNDGRDFRARMQGMEHMNQRRWSTGFTDTSSSASKCWMARTQALVVLLMVGCVAPGEDDPSSTSEYGAESVEGEQTDDETPNASSNSASPASELEPSRTEIGSSRQSLQQQDLPFRYSRQDWVNGDYHFIMSTDVQISNNGRIDWMTTVASTYWLKGFTGGQVIVITDANDNTLWKSVPEQYGHGGTWVNGGPRMIPNGAQLPSDVLSNAAKIAVVHYHDPYNRLAGILTVGARVAVEVLPLLVALF